MILAESLELTTGLFPVRIPEVTEAMSPEENASFTAFQATDLGRALYSAFAVHVARKIGRGGGRIISVAEGEGFLAHALARLLPEAAIIGTDVCPLVVERARAKHRAANLTFEVAAAHELARLGPARAVVCMNALHHFDDAAAGISAMVSSVVPGGCLYIQDLRRDASAGAYFRVLDTHVFTGLGVAGLFRASVQASYTRAELEALVTPHAAPGTLELGAVAFDEAACDVFRTIDPDAFESLPVVLANIEGLWIEAKLRRAR